MKKNGIKKTAQILLLLVIFAGVMLVLLHPAKNGRKTTEYLPQISDRPVYVECKRAEPLQTQITMKETVTISGLQLLMVNLSSESRGSLIVTLRDSAQNVLLEQTLSVNSIVPGEWFTVEGEALLSQGESYIVSFYADDSEPYFMRIDKESAGELPFDETVLTESVGEDSISMGIHVVTPVEMTFGEIFYYSVPIAILLLLAGILVIVFGKDRILALGKRIPVRAFLERYGNACFLVLLFAFFCMNIYFEGYSKGVYITSDSAGYLREAVNLANGHGFFYDGLAGYRNWFANWPILYPLLIAGVMLVTGTNAYLASKITAMLLVGVLLLLLLHFYKNEAWIYAICVLNLGFVQLTQYTWSEVSFIVCLCLFVLLFAKIVCCDKPERKDYIGLGLAGYACFLTRYFGIYIWIVTGAYIIYYAWEYYKNKQRELLVKAQGLTVTAFLTGLLSIGYLLLNKCMNGHASGVSRTLWWDDYEMLTNDLIQSLLTEICNAFAISIPDFVDAYPYSIKVLLLFVILAGLFAFVKKTAKPASREGVLLTFGTFYYVIFIAIRYVSSMDTFYFRFFEPASFLLCLGLLGLLLPYLRNKKGLEALAVFLSTCLVLGMATILQTGGLREEDAYYHRLTAQWEEAYAEIPLRSVVIFSELDFRSSYYRPDVVSGEIRPEDSYEAVCQRYYGSEYICIKKENVKIMLESGEYEPTIAAKMEEALKKLQENQEYAIIATN